MQLLDLILLVAVVGFVVHGFVAGLTTQLPALVGLVAGIALGVGLAPAVAGLSDDLVVQALVVLAVVLLPGLVLGGIGEVGGRRLAERVRDRGWRVADSILGGVLSAALAALALWIAVGPLQDAREAGVLDASASSAVLRGVEEWFPSPPNLTDGMRELLDDTGLLRTTRRPVPDPLPADVAAAAMAGQSSTVRVRGDACPLLVEGSGAVVGDELVVTNAHVVAGQVAPVVSWQGDDRLAQVVGFDEAEDLAILRVRGLEAPAFELDLNARRGDSGAVLGFPEGGPFTVSSAAVRGRYLGEVPALRGDDRVRREVLELQASVRSGDSGGPFVRPDGRLAGIVFGRSLGEQGVGYAVPAGTVAAAVAAAADVTAPVPTGACLRG
jgi:S1-C subfamily serine protease